MIDHAREAVEISKGRIRADLDTDRLLELALTRLLEVIGEAAAKLPETVRADMPSVPWSDVISLRNRLIHAYDSIDLDILWQIIEDDLPPLVEALDRSLESE